MLPSIFKFILNSRRQKGNSFPVKGSNLLIGSLMSVDSILMVLQKTLFHSDLYFNLIWILKDNKILPTFVGWYLMELVYDDSTSRQSRHTFKMSSKGGKEVVASLVSFHALCSIKLLFLVTFLHRKKEETLLLNAFASPKNESNSHDMTATT